MNDLNDKRRNGIRRWGAPAALLAAGAVAGGVLAGTLSASADTGTSAASSTTGSYAGSPADAPRHVDQSKSQRPDEHLLSGDTASKVRAAALAKYPGATILRVETDSDGVYEAHLTTTAGKRVTVEVDKSFTVTGEEAAPAGGMGHDDMGRAGAAPGDTSPQGESSTPGNGV